MEKIQLGFKKKKKRHVHVLSTLVMNAILVNVFLCCFVR